MTSRGSDSFTFNYANQLAQTVIGGTTATSTYNGDGLRMSHTVGAATANYVWDVSRSVPEILQDGTNSYVYGLGLISSTDGSGVQTYYDTDGLGSTADLTNNSATKTDGYTYDAFGAPTHSTGSSTQPFQFTGQQTDADSGLQYLRARYYDPSTGRFLGQDPITGFMGIPQTQNRYPYALGNPVSRTDPLGLSSIGGPRPGRSDKEGGPQPTPQPTPTPTARPTPRPYTCHSTIFGFREFDFICRYFSDPVHAALDSDSPISADCANALAEAALEAEMIREGEQRYGPLPNGLKKADSAAGAGNLLQVCLGVLN